MPKIGASLADELRYAAQDIRQSWEALWFGEAVTPANQLHHRDVSREDFDRYFGEGRDQVREPAIEPEREIER
jgi:hypothetical protein